MVHLQILPLWSLFTLASNDHEDPKWPLKFFFQFSSIKAELQSCKTTILLHKSNYNGNPAIWLENDDAQWNLLVDHGVISILSSKSAKMAKFYSTFTQVKNIFPYKTTLFDHPPKVIIFAHFMHDFERMIGFLTVLKRLFHVW